MSTFTLTTPVALLVFNRPETTARVFSAIREARPAQLLVVADGPRSNRPDDLIKCAEVSRIVDQVDWPCTVLKNYADVNLGCRMRVSSGLDWVFSQVEEAIILEDDCLPHPFFFEFCERLLVYYKTDTRIMHIGGSNYQSGKKRGEGSYYFSRLNHIWGWATWRRAWKFYDVGMGTFPSFLSTNQIANVFTELEVQAYWINSFLSIYRNKLDTWDYQWTYAMWCQDGLAILPNVNMIANIGFHSEATHTKDSSSLFANMPTFSMDLIEHPSCVLPDIEADKYSYNLLFKPGPLKSAFNKIFKYVVELFCSAADHSKR
jgi:hypothetical protein